jgi:hypothetical protein
MVFAPGFVSDLGPNGQRGWDEYINGILMGTAAERGAIETATEANGGQPPSLLLDGDPALAPGMLLVDWPGYPVRVKQALNKSDAELDPFIDWTRAGQTVARGLCHEEYLEWRTVKQPDGKIIRIEMTTETPDYWQKLARYEPRRLVDLAARFAGETTDRVDIQELFGVADPFSIDPFSQAGEQLENAYRAQNWADRAGRIRGHYNNGVRAIMHMAQGANSTNAAIQLAVFAAYPFGKTVNGADVALSGPEAIFATSQAAVNCRNSDPTIVGVGIEKVFSGSKIALMGAIGLYIVSFNGLGLRLPDGSPMPSNWVSYQRGTHGNANPTGRDLFQRLTIHAPPGSALTVGDLVDFDGNRVVSGTQISRLVNVGLFVRATGAGEVTVPRTIIEEPEVPLCPIAGQGSENFVRLWERYSAEPSPDGGALMRRG